MALSYQACLSEAVYSVEYSSLVIYVYSKYSVRDICYSGVRHLQILSSAWHCIRVAY